LQFENRQTEKRPRREDGEGVNQNPMVAVGQVFGQSIHQTAARVEESVQHNGDDPAECRKIRRSRKPETDPA